MYWHGILVGNPLSLTSSVYPAMKNPENTEAESNDVEAADEGDIQMEYCCD